MSSLLPNGRSIVLIGLMGCGKSTVGRELSRATSFPFLDTDMLIEEQVGMEIPQIFAELGEPRFRALETALLNYLRDNPSSRSSGIIATGGGMILRPENRLILRSLGFVVWLDVDLPNLLSRTARAQNRPLLHIEDRESRLRELMDIRSPLYEQTAHLRINSSNLKASQVVDLILQHAHTFFASPPSNEAT